MPTTKKGLGKGLNVLIPDSISEAGAGGELTTLPLRLIEPNPNQPRKNFDELGLAELASSIKQDGLIQPIVVRPVDKKYQIIAGERRWHACKKLEMKEVPVRIMHADDVRTLRLALAENLQRTNLNPIEVAKAYQELLNATGMTQAELAETVSKSRADVTNTLRLLNLPEEMRNMLAEGRITAGHARAISSVPDDEKKITLANKVAEEKLSVRETERLARLFAADTAVHEDRAATPRMFKQVSRLLRKRLETPVKVKTSRGRSRIEIDFKDEDDLERIFALLNGNMSESGDE